jgi:branched-chain amino acid transport system substrate-binding protein
MFGVVAAAGATGGLAAACGTDDDMGQTRTPSGLTIPIGLVVPNYGSFARIGQEIRSGFLLYLEGTRNLLGTHNVDVRVADEGETPESALAAVNGLLDQGVVAIAGVANPDALHAVADAVQAKQVPLVSANAAPPALTSAFFVWRTSSEQGDAGRSLVEHALRLGSSAYVMFEDSSTGREEAEAFANEYSERGTVINRQPGYVTPSTIAGQLQDARNRGARVIFACYSGPAASDMLKTLHEQQGSGLRIPVLGTGSLTETINLIDVGPLPNDVYTSMFYATDLANDANRRFVTAYHRRQGIAPSAYAMAAYDSAAVLDRALSLVPTDPTGARINQAFSSLGQIESPRGTWTFNINRNPQQRWYLRRLTLDGQVPANLLEADLMVLG